jgi:hypothetical protein
VSNNRLIISSGGGTSGLYAYRSSDGTFAVSVLVYPKAWPMTPLEKAVFQSGEGDNERLTVLLQEGRALTVPVRPSSMPAIEQMTAELDARRKAWRRARKAALQPNQPSASPDDEVIDDATDEELVIASATSLPVECLLRFEPRQQRTAEAIAPVIADPNREAASLTSAIRDLAWLCLRAGALRSAATDGGADETAGQLLDAARAAYEADPLALLAELDFVHELHRLQHRIRKGYVPEEDRLAAIRGRITDRGVLEYEMTGIPLLECRFDEFVEATPLFRVLVTALDVVASGTLRSTLGIGTDGLFGSGSEVHPMTMREQLRSIPSLPLPVARATADRLRLTRLQQDWQRPLDLARRILRAESVETGEATQEGSMTVWTVDTPKVWESILEQAFEAAGSGTEVSRPKMPPPWIGLGEKRQVDLTVRVDKQTYLVDAKYKLGTPGSSTADQYQLFAYSLLHGVNYSKGGMLLPFNDEDRPAATALVYPLLVEQGELPKDAEAWAERVRKARPESPFIREFLNTSGEHPKVVLHLLQAPFPPPETARDEDAWRDFLTGVGEGLVGVLPRKAE